MRAVAYIDGMNFYEASKDKQWYPAGWCNWMETIVTYAPSATGVSVKYFTTLYTGGDRIRARRQKLHVLAMEQVAKADVIYGTCRQRDLRCPECKAKLKCSRCDCDRRLSEKMTDVNIGVRLVEDAIDGAFDRAYLVTADIDLVPAVHAALRRAPESQVIVLLPPESVMAEEFAALEQKYPERAIARHLELSKLRRFPDDLPRRWGMMLPIHWRADAGRRPAKPTDQVVRDLGVPAPWYEESTGYGTSQTSPNMATRRRLVHNAPRTK